MGRREMTISYLGNFRHNFCTEYYVAKTLESMGHTIIRLQEDMVGLDETVAAANDSDLFIWQRTPGFLKFDGWAMLKAIKVLKVSYHLDLYMSIEREKDVPKDPFFFTDYVFQADGDPESLRKFKALGINAIWSPAAMYEFESYIAEPKEEYKTDLVFVGGLKNYHKEWTYRPIMISWLKEKFGDRLKMYSGEFGNYIMKHPLNQLMSSAKINIGDTICMGLNHQNYWSNRVPETLGRGGFMIFPRVPGLDKFFKDKEHIVYYDFGDFKQLRNLIKYYLDHEDERKQIIYNAVREVRANHTFTNRWQEIFKILRKDKKL